MDSKEKSQKSSPEVKCPNRFTDTEKCSVCGQSHQRGPEMIKEYGCW